MEGFLQSLKFQSDEDKKAFSEMDGRTAKLAGTDIKYESLYWQGKKYDRYSKEYLELLMRVYEALCLQSISFQNALRTSYPRILMHTIGKWERGKTVLTWREFTQILAKVRSKIVHGIFPKSEGEK